MSSLLLVIPLGDVVAVVVDDADDGVVVVVATGSTVEGMLQPLRPRPQLTPTVNRKKCLFWSLRLLHKRTLE